MQVSVAGLLVSSFVIMSVIKGNVERTIEEKTLDLGSYKCHLCLSLFSGDSDYIDYYERSEIEELKTIVSTKPTIRIKKDYEQLSSFTNSNQQEESEVGDSENKKISSNWFLLGLSGNTSLVHRRLPDFMNYLKINIGGLTGTDYENVKVNSVSYVPSLIVNISFGGNYSVAQVIK